MMNGMAGSAGDIGERVLRASYVDLLKIARMAGEAGFQHASLRHQGKRIRNGGLAAVRGHVRFARPVASFQLLAALRTLQATIPTKDPNQHVSVGKTRDWEIRIAIVPPDEDSRL